jgi:hypothetical protein
MPNKLRWDAGFLDESMAVVREMVDDAIQSRRKVFEETYTMHSLVGGPVETIVITVKRERAR